jgi:Ca-activated chloride channel homolog
VGWILKSSVDEVALLFAATDHGKSVTNLTSHDIRITDNNEPPAAIVGFRSEAQLPLRLALLIDTSDSISGRFAFEQAAADRFVRNVLTNHADLGFLVGFANSVLLVRDFTAENTRLADGIQQLAPAGGTALWDAVDFAARKLSSRNDPEAVARILVVISDGDDNSSNATLKEAIQSAQRGQVAVYTISTYERPASNVSAAPVGERALKVLAEQTGGASFVPGSVRSLSRSLDELQEVIRSRYLVSYRPAHLRLDGSFRNIGLKAEKSGHKLHVYSRKGYYAKSNPTAGQSF